MVDGQIDLLGPTPTVAYRRLRKLSEGPGSSGFSGKSSRRRTASECTLVELNRRETVQVAGLGTSYSTNILEDPEENLEGAEGETEECDQIANTMDNPLDKMQGGKGSKRRPSFVLGSDDSDDEGESKKL